MPHEQRDGATHARAAAPPRFPSMYQLGLMILADECPPDGKFYMCRMGCAGEIDDVCADCWRHYLHYVASAGRSDPYRRTDSATTFDSPFPAVLLAVWGLGIPLCPPLVRAGAF